jgi:hypothetical protein
MSDETREAADKNLRDAMERRAEVVAQEEHAKDMIAHHTAEMVKAERLLERMQTARPTADENVREAFDFYRHAMQEDTQ